MGRGFSLDLLEVVVFKNIYVNITYRIALLLLFRLLSSVTASVSQLLVHALLLSQIANAGYLGQP